MNTAALQRPWAALLVLGALWLLSINQLRVEWSINPQYAYGWAVPFLVAYLLAERWRSRPAIGPWPARGVLIGLVVLAAAFLLPLRMVAEAAPDWRALSWALALVVVGLSLAFVYGVGGRPWLVHFAFPLFFFLVAVPWPMPLEQALVQKLMRGVTAICVEIFGWLGQPALQHGNVIEIGSGRVGVEEACSGVRSLQTMFMGGLFLGELFRLTLLRRAALVGSVLILAFIFNVVRALTLIGITVQGGAASATRWHDTVGLTVLVVSFAGLAGLAALLRGRAAKAVPVTGTGSATRGRTLPRGVLIAGAAWLLLVEVGTEAWYRWHEAGRTPLPSWSVQWPESAPGFREVPLTEGVRAMLRYDDGRSAAWTGPDGNHWATFFLRWNPGRASVQLARNHGPEICLSSAGAVLREDFGVRPVPIRGLDLPFHSYLFTVGETPMYVSFCLWEDRTLADGPASTVRSMTQAARLKDVRLGNRNRGQQVLELAVVGPQSFAEAERATVQMIEALIRQ